MLPVLVLGQHISRKATFDALTNTIPNEDSGTSELLLGIPSHVRADHRQADREPDRLARCQPERYEPAPSMICRQTYEHAAASDTDEVAYDHDDAAHARPTRRNPAAEEQ